MSRPYSDKLLRELSANPTGSLGQRLGKLCVESNLPATYVAKALGCSRMTLYGWFHGQGISEKNRGLVEAFIRLVKKDSEAGILPAKSVPNAKKYIEEMIGETI